MNEKYEWTAEMEASYQAKLAVRPIAPQPFDPDKLVEYRQAVREWERTLTPEELFRLRLEGPVIVV